MSRIVAALMIATALASPAFAQSYDPSVGSGNIVNSPYQNNPTVPAHETYAQNPRAVHSPHAFTTPHREHSD
jgi:hypothetical protein